MTNERPSWDIYFAELAKHVSTRSTCNRKQVGAVIVRDKIILYTGYNGSIRGTEHCNEIGCLLENGHCIRTIHAEANAIVQAAKNGVNIDGGSIYTTASPCFNCFKLIANSGINRIYYSEMYGQDSKVVEFANKIGIELVSVPYATI